MFIVFKTYLSLCHLYHLHVTAISVSCQAVHETVPGMSHGYGSSSFSIYGIFCAESALRLLVWIENTAHLVSKPAWLLQHPNRWKWAILLMFRSNLFCNLCSFVGQRRTGPRLSLGSPKLFFLHSITWWSFGSLPLLPCFWLA